MSKSLSNKPNDRESGTGKPSGFPRNSLEDTLVIAEAIHDKNAGNPWPPMDVAQAIGASPGSSVFRDTLSSSYKYGLTTGAFNQPRVALTSLGTSIVQPTSPEARSHALWEAALNPQAFKSIFGYFKGKKLPDSPFFENTLTREFGIAKEHAPECVTTFVQNVEFVGLVRQLPTGKWLGSDIASTPQETLASAPEAADPSVVQEIESDLGAAELVARRVAHPTVESEPAVTSVFLAHGRNKKLLEQVKQVVTFGQLVPVVAEERETTAIPVPDKVIKDMHSCQAGIIIVSADARVPDGSGGETYRINENVLIEIGAATVLYKKKVILLWDKRIAVPSNLQGLYRCEFEGDTLDWDTGVKLQKTLTEFRAARAPGS
jgi:predicted nucleotide-binding protein